MKHEPIHSARVIHADHTIAIDWYPDDTSDTPWERSDGHGPVSEWTRRDKRPGEWKLCGDHGYARYYDAQEAARLARADGWGLSEEETAKLARRLGRAPTQGEIRAAAVESNFQYLRAWCNDEWQYVGYTVTITDPDGHEMPFPDDSLWGIDSPAMAEFEAEATQDARDYIDRETAAALDAACRDIATV